jgi:rare lipoprotein A
MPPGEVGPGWSQEGVASWYGDPFHGRRTASGEVYNMDAPTAAHPGLPFGTLIRVENLDNGRSTVLRVNDRGPFARGRILDVSRHGARELGMIGPGTARVRVVVEEVPRPRDCWDVQVGSFRDAGNAEEVRRRLAGEGWPVRVEEAPGGIRRVVSGPLVRVEARELTGRHGGLVMGCAGGGAEG